KTITAYDNAGNTSTATLTLTPDSTAPNGQTIALSGGPYYTSLSVPLTLGNGSDAGAGLDTASGVVQRASATLSAGNCGSFGSYSTITLSGGADTSVLAGNCYRYTYTIADNVGNQSAASTASADAKIDTSAPSAPALTLNESSPKSYVSGSTLYYNAHAANSASFTVDATSSDNDSAI